MRRWALGRILEREAPLSAIAAQLTIYDELERDEPLGMSRIGEGLELGMTLLLPLTMRGWQVSAVDEGFTPFAGNRTFVLRRDLDGLEIRAVGESLGDVAVELFAAAAPFTFGQVAA